MANTQVTLSLPQGVLRRAQALAQRTGRPLDEVLAETIELALSPLGEEADDTESVSTWSDGRVLKLADAEMTDDRLLSKLLDRQQSGELSAGERGELSALMEVYQSMLLRKSRALAEAVRRGIRPAPAP